MKYLFVLLLSLGIVISLSSCSDDSTGNDDNGDKSGSFTTENVKSAGSQFFTFSSNTAASEEPENYDLKFTLITRLAEVGVNSCVYFSVGQDPIMLADSGITIAKVDAASLDDVTTIPSSENFKADDPTNTAVIGGSWLDNTYSIEPDVFVVKSCDDNYALVSFADYSYDPAVHQISGIKFYYKYNDDGSMDFTNTTLDSFTTENAYTQTRYFSFSDGNLDFAYGSWQLQVTDSDIWLGPNCSVMRLENTDINDVTVVSGTSFEYDTWPTYVTAGWYDSDENHHINPLDYVYVVHTNDDNYVAFEVLSYYDDMGNSGAFTIDWKYLNN